MALFTQVRHVLVAQIIQVVNLLQASANLLIWSKLEKASMIFIVYTRSASFNSRTGNELNVNNKYISFNTPCINVHKPDLFIALTTK